MRGLGETVSVMGRAEVIDLFCGAGGLTLGLEKAGLTVVEGVDVDGRCRYPYEKNTGARFVTKDVGDYHAKDLEDAWGNSEYRVLVGCAPCQPFSTYARNNRPSGEYGSRWELIDQFATLMEETFPDVVSMENVAPFARTDVYRSFVVRLIEAGYSVKAGVADCRAYGAPQMRRRLVLLASRHGPIELLKYSTPNAASWTTVRSAIGHLPALRAGEVHLDDQLHRSSRLSSQNLARIKVSKPGGTWRDWPKSLVATCHTRESGKTYPSVYGRMEWDQPSPTITGQCFGFGNGRFGHPDQDRAVSLREAALLQTFPESFEFFSADTPFPGMATIGGMIGNAVPPLLGYVIGQSIVRHLETATSRSAV